MGLENHEITDYIAIYEPVKKGSALSIAKILCLMLDFKKYKLSSLLNSTNAYKQKGTPDHLGVSINIYRLISFLG